MDGEAFKAEQRRRYDALVARLNAPVYLHDDGSRCWHDPSELTDEHIARMTRVVATPAS